jgi:hypothetical protein
MAGPVRSWVRYTEMASGAAADEVVGAAGVPLYRGGIGGPELGGAGAAAGFGGRARSWRFGWSCFGGGGAPKAGEKPNNSGRLEGV